MKCYHKVVTGGLIKYNHPIKKRGISMPQSYIPEFKKKIVRLHLDEGRTYKSITA